MKDMRSGYPAVIRRWVVGLAVLITATSLVAPNARAQDPFTEFFGGLFGGGGRAAKPRPRPAEPSAPTRVRRIMPHQENRAPTYWRRGESRRDAVSPSRSERGSPPATRVQSGDEKASIGTPIAPPAAGTGAQTQATYYVAVMGDALGVLLSNGLEEVLGDIPDIKILKDGKSSSGLVRDDFYDWPKAARDIAGGGQKVDVAVMMIGSNDRQQIRQATETLDPMTTRWREIYVARVDSVLQPFREKKIPVVWVGLPVMKSESFSADMAKLNDIYKERAQRQGDVYVDLWEAFSDEKGQYNAFGPDIDGEIVKIRSADGVHFTPAGAVSVGHFVAAEIRKLYQARHPVSGVASVPTAPADAPSQLNTAGRTGAGGSIEFRSPVPPAFSTAPSLAERPAIGPIQALGSPRVDVGGELARKSGDPLPDGGDPAARALAHHVFVQGGDQSARKNRADDFSWKASLPGAAK